MTSSDIEEDESLAHFIESEILAEDELDGEEEGVSPEPKRGRVEITGGDNGVLGRIPPELLPNILKFLSSEDLMACSMVCKSMNYAACDESLWRRLYRMRWGLPPQSTKIRQCAWKKLYIQRDEEDMTDLVRNCPSEFKEYYIQMQAAKRGQAPIHSQGWMFLGGIEGEERVDAIFIAVKYLYAFCVSDYLPCLEGLDLDGHEEIIKEASMTLKKYHDPIIDRRIKQWRQSRDNKELQDLLDVFITLKDSNGEPLLTSEEIKAQAIEIMIAAVDNPSNAVEWAMAEMINQPELMRKAVEEPDQVVGKDRLVQESNIPRLNYVKACARLFQGSHVIVSRLGLGRNPKAWNDPLKFNPKRHLGDGCTNVVLTQPDLRFISFSTGRRGCIAPFLGTAMTVMLLARFIQGFSWLKSPGDLGIDLSESKHDLFLAKPLNARAEARLPLHLYTSF